MRVQLRFVGSLARKAGRNKVVLELPDSITLIEALKKIFKTYKLGVLDSDLNELISGYVQIYVNGRIPRMDYVLQEGDEISFLPPIAGG